MSKLIWWEKTVEYFFVAKHLPHGFIAPLDGNHEKTSDAILSLKDNKFILIEFKRDKRSVSVEKKKFSDFENTKRELGNQDNHHLLIYGDVQSSKNKHDYDSKQNFEFLLIATTYFSEQAVDINNIIDNAISGNIFKKYISTLLKYKKEGSSGTNGIANNALVIGVSDTGQTTCMSLMDFGQKALVIFTLRKEKATRA